MRPQNSHPIWIGQLLDPFKSVPNDGLLSRRREGNWTAILHHGVMSTQIRTSKIEVGKFDPRGYNRAAPAMTRADKAKCRNKALVARNTVCLGAVICSVFAGPAVTTRRVVAMSNARHVTPLENSISRRMPPCIAESAFFKSLPTAFRWPDPGDSLSLRVLKEYGALFVARGGAVVPSVVIFPDPNAVAQWQSNLSTEQVELAGIPVRLQSAAMRALTKAREEAVQAHVRISPRGRDAIQRSYEETLELWKSRVNPGLRHWVERGLLSAAEAERTRKLPAREQAAAILELETRGLYFSEDFSKSILYSVAPPGASQHLSMLAFDVKEHDNPVVRSILEHHGWFQTVRSDLPHFTYLGVKKQLLPSLGLKMLRNGDRAFWIPDVACPQPPKP